MKDGKVQLLYQVKVRAQDLFEGIESTQFLPILHNAGNPVFLQEGKGDR